VTAAGTSPIGASPWIGATPVASTPVAATVTLVEGQTFALSWRNGDMDGELPHGLFVMDTRVLSSMALRLNGHTTEALAVDADEPGAATYVTRGRPVQGQADADVLCVRRRGIGAGMTEHLAVTNHGLDDITVVVELVCDADFATLFEVKERRVVRRGVHRYEQGPSAIRFEHEIDEHRRAVEISWSEGTVERDGVSAEAPAPPAGSDGRGRIRWTLRLPSRTTWHVDLRIDVEVQGRRLRHPAAGAGAGGADTFDAWRAGFPRLSSDDLGLDRVVARTRDDLGALRIVDPEDPSVVIVAAGAPWFMTLFGRDSLITAWMTMLADPSLARGVLQTLARRQGRRDDADTEEEPGKILHEVRFDAADTLELGGGTAYYGSVDATPLFVMLLGELARWQPDDPCIDELWPAADAALTWLATSGDRDGDGFVEYQRRSAHGLANQGWKDSWDALRWSDGSLVEGPIALCEVQGYAYAAQVAGARLARARGDDARAADLERRAADLRAHFNRAFWLDDAADVAVALDGRKRPVDALASNVGHCLWTGILDEGRAANVARRLLSPGSFSGWGIRTLDASMRAFNPVSYHNGSVWPHDNAICAAGLARYGFHDQAHRVIRAQLDVATHTGDRLPELFAGFDRDEIRVPAAYPASCSPQAWATASPLLWLATVLGLDPDRPGLVDPHLPPWLGEVVLRGIEVRGEHLDISVTGGRSRVEPRHR
jgi:glycogen debranching enzyme